MKCRLCGDDATTIWRCDKCYKCDVCGGDDLLASYDDVVRCDGCQADWVATQRIEMNAAFAADPHVTAFLEFVVCPSCGHRHEDSFAFGDGVNCCACCETEFYVDRSISVTYTTSRIVAGRAHQVSA